MSMQVNSSSVYQYPQPSTSSTSSVTSSQSSPNYGDIVDKISDEYDQLSPEEQRNARLYVGGEVASYQQKQQAEIDAKRNVVVGVSAVNHQQNLLDTYYTSATGNDSKNSGSNPVSYKALESINSNLEQQKQVNQQLAIAEFYAKYGGGNEEPQPEPYQSVALAV
ncbi:MULTISPECIES: hypothetical protein [unclassified Agarivorans]|uniref:hypothetical protein n=1 Tax=unclassified Agarivorans TaxID=2636026 RepID=UPI0026E19ECC|nr:MULTISPECIES: hypothetical protein [unclassified Agarivorans]MDO6684249.1 hypothetical protein [Agarivorans sp. 3_MG-2023]MDO6714017.1 hypothetical protein [Agarivorans sp. 2_MG-2023]